MQAIVETLFDAVYLISVITIGILMIRGSKGNAQFKLFGLMAVVLGAGDSFHLVPRALALCTTGLENYTVPLGLGKWITSITMTVFYVLLSINYSFCQNLVQSSTIEDVVTQYETSRIITNKLLTDNKGLRQTIWRRLLCIFELHSELAAIT